MTGAREARRSVSCAAKRTARSYEDSIAYCESLEAHDGRTYKIASIHSGAENDEVLSLISCVSYMGGVELDNGEWDWEDGSPMNYIHSSNDGLYSTGEDKLAMDTTGKWHDWGTGSSTLGVVCRLEDTVPTSAPTSTWAPTQTPGTFVTDSTSRSYDDSVAYCETLEAHDGRKYKIASIHSAEENAEVLSLISCVSYMGGVELDNAAWDWEDGSSMDYIHSSNDGLYSSAEDKLAMDTTGKWHDWGTGSSTLGVICRLEDTVPTPAPTITGFLEWGSSQYGSWSTSGTTATWSSGTCDDTLITTRPSDSFEVYISSSGYWLDIGICTYDVLSSSVAFMGFSGDAWIWRKYGGLYKDSGVSSTQGTDYASVAYDAGDTVGVQFDGSSLYFYKNGANMGAAPIVNSMSGLSGSLYPCVQACSNTAVLELSPFSSSAH
jgi:hypothetical protein